MLVERSYATFALFLTFLALAPGNLLFALGKLTGGGWRVFAIDTRTLTHLFTFGEDLGERLAALAVVGDELFVGGQEGIHVFSFAGKPLRVIRGDFGQPYRLRFINERLYLTVWVADVKASQKIHVLTPQGETLQVYDMPEGRPIVDTAVLGRKLIVCSLGEWLSHADLHGSVMQALLGA